MSKYIFLDIETKQTFEDIGGRYPEQLGVSVAVTYDYIKGFKYWEEGDLHELFQYISNFQFVIGYNLLDFDYQVLFPYDHDNLLSDIEEKTIDLLSLIESSLGHRISLDDISSATLGRKKTGSGLEAVKLWKRGQIVKLKKYCAQDVQLTVSLFEYAQLNGCLYYTKNGFKRKIDLKLPLPSSEICLNMQLFKLWMDGYFESLVLGESVSKKQLGVLKEKVNALIENFEIFQMQNQDDLEDDEENDEDSYSEDEQDDEEVIPNSKNQNQQTSPYDVADDFPF